MSALVLFLLYVAFVKPQEHGGHRPHLLQDEVLRLPGPPEDFAALVDLGEGYHKRVRTYIGSHMAVALLDTGSFRNCIDEKLLTMLEEKQRKRELGDNAVISPRQAC